LLRAKARPEPARPTLDQPVERRRIKTLVDPAPASAAVVVALASYSA
jgi:hypothetical protein